MNSVLRKYLEDKDAMIFTSDAPGFDFLDEGDEWVHMANPHGSEDLLLRLSSKSILLYFGEWSSSYSNDEEGNQSLLEEIESIMDDRAYVWKSTIGDMHFVSLVKDEPGLFFELARRGFAAEVNGQLVEIQPSSEDDEFTFWDPAMMHPTPTSYLN